MKLRGPENYSTDLEQQMLMSQTGTIVSKLYVAYYR
jgi:hypothetical protein